MSKTTKTTKPPRAAKRNAYPVFGPNLPRLAALPNPHLYVSVVGAEATTSADPRILAYVRVLDDPDYSRAMHDIEAAAKEARAAGLLKTAAQRRVWATYRDAALTALRGVAALKALVDELNGHIQAHECDTLCVVGNYVRNLPD